MIGNAKKWKEDRLRLYNPQDDAAISAIGLEAVLENRDGQWLISIAKSSDGRKEALDPYLILPKLSPEAQADPVPQPLPPHRENPDTAASITASRIVIFIAASHL